MMVDATATSERHAVASPTFYKPELDVLRFVAFFSVFLHHIFPRTPEVFATRLPLPVAEAASAIVNAFGFGLPLFFFLSAYLISRLLMIEATANSGRIDFFAFYVRRILRIWPLYFFGLAIGVSIAVFNGASEDQHMFLWYAVFVGNFYFLSHPWSENPMTPLWSISIEEQFYLVAPFFIWLVGNRRVAIVGASMIAISAVALWVQGQAHREIDTAIWSNSLSQLVFFGAGIVCAGLRPDAARAPAWQSRVLFLLSAIVLFFCAACFTEMKRIGAATSGVSVAGGYLMVALGCCLALLAVENLGNVFPRMLIYLGKISYGLYVFHLLGLQFIQKMTPLGYSKIGLIAGLFLTIVFASLSYKFVERPFLKLRQRFTLVPNRPI